ncbi:T9SS type A sorting domain-containing protein [bacterium]|nr:T9SS type A sorting domain-containing protein [bacterium]
MRLSLCLCISLLLISGSIAAPEHSLRAPCDLPADRIVTLSDPIPTDRYVQPDHSWTPRRDDYIGEISIAGETYYDYMSNGAISKWIAVDPDGAVHVTWMDAYDIDFSTRHQKYNFYRNDEWYREDGVTFEEGDKSGYGCLTLTMEEIPRVIVFAHYRQRAEDDYVWIAGIDYEPYYAAFTNTIFPSYPNHLILWPQGVASRNGAVHVIGNPITDEIGIAYLPAFLDEYGDIDYDVDFPSEVGTTHLNTYRIARSPNSDRVAITWISTRLGIPAPGPWDGFLAYQMNNDLWLAYTDDGENWNFDEPINVTNCIMPDANRVDRNVYGDTLLPYCTHDVIFDPDDNIHIVFDTRKLLWNPLSQESPPIDGLTVDYSYLFHWSEETNDISPVADGWFSQQIRNEDNEIVQWPTPGAWRSNVCYPSLAYDDNGDLYCVFNYYPTDDFNDYVDGDGYGRCNGDIAVTVSEDNGDTWYMPTMVVETTTHLPEPGEADCEGYPTVAEMVDDYLHIFYINDKEAGTSVQDDITSNTLNPMIYQKIPVDEILREEIWEDGPAFHMSFRPLVQDGVRDPGVPTPGNPVHVRANVTPDEGHELEQVTLLYRIDEGDEQSVAMENVEGDIYAGTIPAQDEGVSVWYKIRATNDEDVYGYGPSSIWYWSYVVREDGILTIQDIQTLPHLEWSHDLSPYIGYVVTTSGVVTTSTTFNQQYGAYAIQNGEGDWSGLFVRGIDDELEKGSVIQVTGMVMEQDPQDSRHWEYATYIDVESYSVIGSDDVPEPLIVDLGELVWLERAEQLEGVLVQTFDFWIEGIYQEDLDRGYWAITNQTIEGLAWFNTNGLTPVEIKNRSLFLDEEDGIVTHTSFEWMKGIFTENWGHYAIAPSSGDEVGPLAVEKDGSVSPYYFQLDNPFPNPFNAVTNVSFELSNSGLVRLALFDLTGREIAVIAEGSMSAGRYSYSIDASALAAGVYILRLNADTRTASRKLLLLK